MRGSRRNRVVDFKINPRALSPKCNGECSGPFARLLDFFCAHKHDSDQQQRTCPENKRCKVDCDPPLGCVCYFLSLQQLRNFLWVLRPSSGSTTLSLWLSHILEPARQRVTICPECDGQLYFSLPRGRWKQTSINSYFLSTSNSFVPESCFNGKLQDPVFAIRKLFSGSKKK